MTVATMRLRAAYIGQGARAAIDVLCSRYHFEMLGIDATTHATQMIDLQIVRDFASVQNIADAMSELRCAAKSK